MGVEARIAPFINIEFVVTSEWWEEPRNHRRTRYSNI